MKSASPPPFFKTQRVSPGWPSERRAPYTLLFSKGFGVPHIIPASFPTGRIRSVFRPLILCSARYSPFLPDLVRTSSDWVNPFSINGSSRKGRFRGLWEHAPGDGARPQRQKPDNGPAAKAKAVVGAGEPAPRRPASSHGIHTSPPGPRAAGGYDVECRFRVGNHPSRPA